MKALAVVTTNYASGRSEGLVDTLQQQIWSGSQTTVRRTSLTLDHVMASAALPFFFPSVKLQQQWHGDGGIRLARRYLLRCVSWGQAHFWRHRCVPNLRWVTASYQRASPPGQVAGVMLNAVFLDLLVDALQMQRVNDLLSRIPSRTGDDSVRWM